MYNIQKYNTINCLHTNISLLLISLSILGSKVFHLITANIAVTKSIYFIFRDSLYFLKS